MDYREFLKDQNRIAAEDVLTFRRKVFGDAIVSLAEAESVFALNDHIEETCREWDEFFIEVMSDYLVNQANPRGYVSENNADWLIQQITHDGHLQADSELELLIRIIERAREVPSTLSAFALSEIAHAVLEGNGKLVCDTELSPGVIGAPEANLVRRVLYGVGDEGRLAVSKEEAEVLFDLNDKTVEAENSPEWNDVFVKAVACHVMKSSGYQAPSRHEMLRREEWLDDTTVDVTGMLSKTLSSMGSVLRNGGFLDAMKAGHRAHEDAWGNRNREAEMHAASDEAVNHAEAQWLAGRIGRDAHFHANEKALLEYLKQESPELDPALQPLLDQVA